MAVLVLSCRTRRGSGCTTQALGLFCVHNGWSQGGRFCEGIRKTVVRSLCGFPEGVLGIMRCVVKVLVQRSGSWPVLPLRVTCGCRLGGVQAQRQRDGVSSPCPAWGAWHHIPPASWSSASVPARRRVSQNRASGNACAGGPSCHTGPTQQRFSTFPVRADATHTTGSPSSRDRTSLTRIRWCSVLGRTSRGEDLCGEVM